VKLDFALRAFHFYRSRKKKLQEAGLCSVAGGSREKVTVAVKKLQEAEK
jgi:hypothetical protein